jgi:hypothetical protein
LVPTIACFDCLFGFRREALLIALDSLLTMLFACGLASRLTTSFISPGNTVECIDLKTYKKMFLFDWDLKDIMHGRHSPKEDLTAGAFWYYINTTFFPYDLQFRLADTPFEEWATSLFERLNTFSFDIPNS